MPSSNNYKQESSGKKNAIYTSYVTFYLIEHLSKIIVDKSQVPYLFSDESGCLISLNYRWQINRYVRVCRVYLQNHFQKLFNKLFSQYLDKEDSGGCAVFHTAIAGISIFTIQKLINHSDTSITMKYAKLSTDSSRNTVMGINIF